MTDLANMAVPQELDSFLVDLNDVSFGTRLRSTYNDIDKLGYSMLELGQIHAITVRPATPKDNCVEPWVIVTGGRRFTAAIKIGWKQIRVENLEHLSEWKRKAVELEENIQRSAMTWQEEVEAKQQLAALYKSENPSWTDTKSAELLHIDRAQLSRDLKLANAIDAHPELAKASSKKAALRLLDTKRSLAASAARVSTIDHSRLETSLVCADAAQFLAALEDNSVDLFLSDLPFGIDYFELPANDRLAGGGLSKFDDSLGAATSLLHQILPLMAQKVKPTGWICFMLAEDLRWALKSDITIFNTQKSEARSSGKKLSTPTLPWIWYRPNSRSNPIDPHKNAKSVYDLIVPINPGGAVLRKSCDNLLVFDSIYEERVHAHQKPIPLGEELISRFTLPGDLVVDVTMGSGALLAAAAKSGRRFLGCDLNEDMIPLARGLVAQYFANTLVREAPTVPPHEELQMSEANNEGLPLDGSETEGLDNAPAEGLDDSDLDDADADLDDDDEDADEDDLEDPDEDPNAEIEDESDIDADVNADDDDDDEE